MTCDDLSKLETRFEIQLPQEYLDVLTNYPFSDGHFGDEMLLDDAELLAQHNHPSAAKRAKLKSGPSISDGYFWIGSDGGELSFYIKLGRSSRGVWYFDIETGEIQKYCDSLEDYLQKCRKIDADEERLPNETSSWPLWKKNIYALSLLIGFILFGYIIFRGARWLLHFTGLI